jgi:hypothetical protein
MAIDTEAVIATGTETEIASTIAVTAAATTTTTVATGRHRRVTAGADPRRRRHGIAATRETRATGMPRPVAAIVIAISTMTAMWGRPAAGAAARLRRPGAGHPHRRRRPRRRHRWLVAVGRPTLCPAALMTRPTRRRAAAID